MQKHHNMTFDEIVKEVVRVCKNNKVEHLSLFGSYARGTQTERSDIDFIAYGVKDIETLREEIDKIMTLKKIDIFDYDEVCNQYLREDMDEYGRKIY